MVRKLAGTLATVGMLSSPLAFALGLGEAELLSSLNQPFKAKIQLAQTQGVSSDDIRVKLADERAFAKAGLDRQFFLQNLSFAVRDSASGPYIELSSASPVKEPFLNFLLEVEWPQGQLMREYTFLIDPPTYNNTLTQQYAQRTQTSQPLAAPAAGNMVEEGARRIKVGPTDTLWSLARKNRPDTGVTIKQAMLAIQDANPDAFPTGNINNMEAGSTILIPTTSAMKDRNAAQATREVARQNKAWVAFKAQAVPVAPAPVVTTPAPAEEKKLTLVAEEEPTSAEAEVSQELALSKETLDQSAREKAELSGRLDELQKQVNTLQKLIRLKDEQLVAMEAMLAKQNQLLSGKSVSEDASEAMPSETPADNSETVVEPPKASTASAATTGKISAGAIGLDLASEAQKQTQEEPMAADSASENEPQPAAEPEPEAQPEPVKSFSLDKQESQELDASSFVMDSLRNNAVLIGGAAAGLLALVLLLVMMRRRRKATDAEKENGLDGSDVAMGATAGAAGAVAFDAAMDDDLPDDLSLDDDLSGDLDDGNLSDTGLDDLNLDDNDLDGPGMNELSLDDLGEPDATATASSEIEDLGDFDLGDLGEDADEADSTMASLELEDDAELDLDSELELDGELDLDDLDFSEDFDLGELDDSEPDTKDEGGAEDPFVQAELTEDTVSTEDADTGESVQDNLIDFTENDNLINLEGTDLSELDSSEEPEQIDLTGDDLSALDFADDELVDDLLAEEEADSDDDILAALTDDAEALANDDPTEDSVADETFSEAVSDAGSDILDLPLSPAPVADLGSFNTAESQDEAQYLPDETQDTQQEQQDLADDLQGPIDEAQAFRDLGQPEQAAAILQRSLLDNPADNATRLKFMEVLVDLNDEATFDHELRQIQDVGDAKALTAALAMQKELGQRVADAPVQNEFDELESLVADGGEPEVAQAESLSGDGYDLDLNSELDALERDFDRYAEEDASSSSDLDDIDFELTDLDFSDDISDNEPMIDLNPADLGEPEPLDRDDFELTDLVDLDGDDELDSLSAAGNSAEDDYMFNESQQELRSDTRDYIEDLGDLSMSASRDSDALELSGLEDLMGQDLAADNDDIIDLSPSIDDEDDLADLGELSDITFNTSNDDSGQLNIDDLLDENDDPEIKLDLARAYVDMGNTTSALEALKDVVMRGNADQKEEANELIAKLQGE